MLAEIVFAVGDHIASVTGSSPGKQFSVHTFLPNGSLGQKRDEENRNDVGFS